jgi:peptidyl-prolyl cis-trans isomerase D
VIEFVLAQEGSDAMSENRLRAFYNKNKQRFAPASRLQVAQIFVPYGDSPDDAAVIKRLDEIRNALRRGDDFIATADALGTEILPPLPRVMLTPNKMTDYLGPDLTAAAARLPQGSISDALAGATGWHFLKITRNQPGAAPAFDDIRGQIIDALRRENDDTALRDYLDWLHQRADIVLAPDAPR